MIRRPGYRDWLVPVGAVILFFLIVSTAVVVVAITVVNNFLD